MRKVCKKIKVYCCGVSFQHEIEYTHVDFYPSIEHLKSERACWKQCGIIELEVSEYKWVHPQDLFNAKP